MKKTNILEEAVFTKSPEELSALYRQLGQVENSGRALALACRFRGLEYVKVLVEGGANFTYIQHYDSYYCETEYWLALLEVNNVLRMAWFIYNKDDCFSNNITRGGTTYTVLPITQRAEIVMYLYQYRDQICLDTGELLFYAIMSDSKKITKILKEFGAKFSEKRITGLTEDGRSYEWLEFSRMLDCLKCKEFLRVINDIFEEIDGKKLHYTDSIYWDINYKQFPLYKPDVFQFILEHFNQKKMNKTKFMKGAIDQNSVACLAICVENGWLQMPRKRDEMIAYAAEQGKTECSAWLLDFKNRTADLAAEREKAEKKMLRELRANPNSVTELKKIWGYEKREDGTIIITRYRGKNTEITVPEKIGGAIVTEIGARAFSVMASRLKKEQINLRRSITRITLPETIRAIGEAAFCDCSALAEINIPDSVSLIGANAFSGCSSLKSVTLPMGITEIGTYTFYGCNSLKSVTIPQTVAVIRNRVFQGCSALEKVTILEGVTEVGMQAFAECVNLKEAVLPSSVEKIKNFTRSGQAPQTIFHNDVHLTVTVTPKSYSEKYCKRNNIKYIYPNEEAQ